MAEKLGGKPADPQRLKAVFDETLEEIGLVLSSTERSRLFEAVVADQPPPAWEVILRDDAIQEIVALGYQDVFVRRAGAEHLERVDSPVFADDDHFLACMNQVLSMARRQIDTDNPFVQVQMLDNTVVRVVLDTMGTGRSLLLIRKPERNPNPNDDATRTNFGPLRKRL